MTQRDQVLEMITAGWVCGTEFLDEHIPRFGARLWQLRQLGHHIEKRLCQRHRHTSRQEEHRLVGFATFEAEGQGTWAVSA